MKRIYVSPPNLDGREKELLVQAFDSNWITTLGPQVDAFEREMCEKIGVANATALASGTAALHLALINLGAGQGDEVISPSLTFSATVNSIVYCGASPLLIDSDSSTWNIDPDLLEEELAGCAKKGKLPKALIAVDLYGQPANYRRIEEICARFGVPLVEDAAEALGAKCDGKFAGAFGEMGVFSFNGNKIITTSGGGMLVSNNKAYTDRARYLATQARDPVPHYQHSAIGYNYRMSNLLAAVGRGQLECLDKKVARRRAINRFYRESLSNTNGIEFMPEAEYGESTFWLTCILIEPDAFGATNEELRLHLESLNIESRNVWKPMHLQPIFKECRMRGGSVCEDLFAKGLCLPSGSGMTDEDLERVVDGISSVSRKGSWTRRIEYVAGVRGQGSGARGQ